jgi:SHS family lactate transporter-like MFS transporter
MLIPLYLLSEDPFLLWLGALLMGLCGAGVFGIVPSYLTERFPTGSRGAGSGFAYHAGAGIGAATPALIGLLQDQGSSLVFAMGTLIAAASLSGIAVAWLGPETRGREFLAFDPEREGRQSLHPLSEDR